MNINAIAAAVVLGMTSGALADFRGSTASINVDVLAVNGTPEAVLGTVNTVVVKPGDTITFGVNGSIPDTLGDFIATAVLKFAPVGPVGTVDPASLEFADALGDNLPMNDVFDDNGLDIQTFDFASNDDSLGTSGQLFTFEFVVADDFDSSFSYDTLVTPGPTDPANRLVGGSPDFNKYLVETLTADTIVVPAPGALALAGFAGLGSLRRRRA